MSLELSVVIPAYNERENILLLAEKVNDAVKKYFNTYEIIFIDDGSTDGSDEAFAQACTSYDAVKVFYFTQNNGQSAAIAAGFEMAQGNLILLMDGDMQTDPEDIAVLMQYIPEYDFVNGIRAQRNDGFKRKLASVLGNGFRNLVTGDNIKDTGCPLKLLKAEVAKSYTMFNGSHRFLPTLAKYMGYKVTQTPVRHYDRQFGESKYKVFGRGCTAFFDVLAVRWMRSRMLHWKIKT